MRRNLRQWIFPCVTLHLVLFGIVLSASAESRWPAEKANAWYAQQPWLAGANFAPSTAINQLEMWQAETFDPATIDRELGWAKELGFNSMRVFLHDLVWKHDREEFLKRIDRFLEIADRHGIGVMFVLFDGVWDPHPKIGPQRAPKPHVHNSGWVQSPGAEILKDPARHDELEGYVKGILSRYRHDRRVQLWDLFNEPDNPNADAYGPQEISNKAEMAFALLKKAFAWAREVNPSQPLTAGVWRSDWSDPAKTSPIERYMLEESDVISFHSYSPLATVRKQVEALKRYGRPLICTEYMARPAGSTFDPVLGYFKEQNVAAYNWGFVSGKSQTIYPWETWKKTYTAEPKVWFHDIFRADGTPFDQKEVEYIKKITVAR
jgi:hypothetical protein